MAHLVPWKRSSVTFIVSTPHKPHRNVSETVYEVDRLKGPSNFVNFRIRALTRGEADYLLPCPSHELRSYRTS